MSNKSDQTASFMVRFTQKIFEDNGENLVQWRGKISHVQGGDQQNFTDINDALTFIKERLAQLTLDATIDKTPEEQDGILSKSLDIWKKMAQTAPKLILDTIKDPKKQVAQIQEQIQEQITQVSDDFSSKVEIDQWRNASKSDLKKVMDSIKSLSQDIKTLNEKVDSLSKPT
jgi:uncharacterized phage infection (PIP) family protein YhgE